MPSTVPPKEKVKRSLMEEFSNKVRFIHWTRASWLFLAAIILLAFLNLALNTVTLFHR